MQVAAGVGADGRQIVNRAVEECTNYKECALLQLPEYVCCVACGILFSYTDAAGSMVRICLAMYLQRGWVPICIFSICMATYGLSVLRI